MHKVSSWINPHSLRKAWYTAYNGLQFVHWTAVQQMSIAFSYRTEIRIKQRYVHAVITCDIQKIVVKGMFRWERHKYIATYKKQLLVCLILAPCMIHFRQAIFNYLSELLVMLLGVCPPGLIKSFLWFSSLRLLLSASSSLMGTDAFEDAIEGDWKRKSAVIDGELVGVFRDDWTTRWNTGVLALSATVFELLLPIKASIAGSFLPANLRWCHQAIGIATNKRGLPSTKRKMAENLSSKLTSLSLDESRTKWDL